MACPTCMRVRQAVNVPLRALRLPTLPVAQPAVPAQPTPTAAQLPANPAWPTRGR